MNSWDAFTDVQADAVRATAAKHLRDADELAGELAPLFIRDPVSAVNVTTQEPRTVVFEGNTVAEIYDPSWTLLGTTESGSGVYIRPASATGSAVNEHLTPVCDKEPSP